MPNTGRFYAPPATAAAYRERYMRPYSTVSPPMGGAGLVNTPTMGGAAKGSGAPPGSASYARSSGFVRRAVATDSDMYANAYESRVRSRPAALYEEDRPWHHGYPEKQFARAQHHAWSEEDDDVSVSVRRGAPLSASIVSLRSNEMARHHRIASAPAYDAPTSRASFDSAPCPSTLPRLSSLLKRGPGDSGNFDDEEQVVTRKRLREASPRRDDFEHEPKMSRRFYEEDVFADRPAPTKYSRGAWGADERAEENRPMRQTVSMPMKNPGSYMSAAQRPVGPRTQISPLASSSRQFAERSRYPYSNNEVNMTSSSEPTRRLSAAHEDHLAVRPRYDNPARAYDMSRRNYYTSEEHRNEPSPVGLKSPPPTAAARDRFSPVGRYSESKDADSVIEAAADLVEERSPSKRESITKLLLKSKEFLKAKSLVRNRNNEIDWVATFLNVGFESNSIYSLMCPLRKGRWKVEEEKYTMELLRLIESGVIRLRHGQSIRGFIAKKLHSDDMRVLKKLSNCKMFHFARLINPRMSDAEEIDESIPNVRASLDRLDKLKAEFLRSVQLEALVAVRKYLSDTSIRDLLNARD